MQLYYLTVLLSFTFSVKSHCMLDMRLDFENNADAMASILPNLKTFIPNLKYEHGKKPRDVPYDILRQQTKNFAPNALMQKFNEKNIELNFNIQQILSNYCQPLSADLSLGQEIQTRDEYPIYNTKCTIDANNNMVYNLNGRFDIMVKKIMMKNFVGFNPNVSMLITLSRVATLVRARECLLNIQAYNVTHVRFDEIQKSIEERTSALSALLQGKAEKQVNLDSVPPLDCKFFTPNPSNPSQGIGKLSNKTVFYMAYPNLTANLEELFFFSPEILQGFLGKCDWLNDDLLLRLKLSIKMVDALLSLHKSGIIHKNIRLSNIYYYYFDQELDDDSELQIFVSYGEFSMSGIDDYDARVMKTFFVPDDAQTELGPMLDVYQLGIAIIQILFMIPSEATPEMTLSKIAKMTDPSARVLYKGEKVHLFEQIMKDAISGLDDVGVYKGIMTNETAVCSIFIFQKIWRYFTYELWDNYKSEDRDLIDSMYYFRPDTDDEISLHHLYKLPKFKSMFMSIFLNLYAITPQCYGNISLPQKVYVTLRGMINPNQSNRWSLKILQDEFQEALEVVHSQRFMNVEYTQYDNSKFIGKNYNSVLRRKQSQVMI